MTMIKPYKKCKKCGALIVSGKLCEDCKPMTKISHFITNRKRGADNG